MNTEKTHERFWEAMRARFGKRWLDEFGPAPTPPWIQLLNAHTPTQLRKALELMAQDKLAHPPTLPVFESLLRRATNKAPAESVDWSRGYWRSVIVFQITRQLVNANFVASEDQVEQYVIDHKASLGAQLRELLNELCDLEQSCNGQRTPGMYTLVESRVRETIGTEQRREAA